MSDREPHLVATGTLKDSRNCTVTVGYRGRDVEITVTPPSGHAGRIVLDDGQRDQFVRAFALAEAETEREDTELERRRDQQEVPGE